MVDLAYFKKPGPNCLSQYTISCYVNGDFTFKDKQEIEKHLEHCQHCNQLVKQEQQRLAESQSEPSTGHSRLPERRQSKSISNWLRPNLLSFAVALVLFLIVIFVILPKVEHYKQILRAKNKNSLWLSVKRGDDLVYRNTSIDKVGTLIDGDKIRIRINQSQAGAIALRGCAHNSCMLLFADKIPKSGWLPFGLNASSGFSTLELWSCPTEQDRNLALIQAQQPVVDKIADCKVSTWQLVVIPKQ